MALRDGVQAEKCQSLWLVFFANKAWIYIPLQSPIFISLVVLHYVYIPLYSYWYTAKNVALK